MHTRTFLTSGLLTTMLCFGLLSFSGPVHAEASDYFDPSHVLNGSGLSTESPTQITLNILEAFLAILGVLDLCLIIYGGFMILTSSGNPEKIKHGRDTLVWAIIGTIIILSSLGILLYLDSAIFPD